MTTNGVSTNRSTAVISIVRQGGSARVGVQRSNAVDADADRVTSLASMSLIATTLALLALVGTILAVIVQRQRRIAPAIFTHAGFNLIALSVAWASVAVQ